MNEEMQKNVENFQIVRRRCVTGAVLIFIGIFIIQVIVYTLTVVGATGILRISGESAKQISSRLSDESFRHFLVECYSVIVSIVYIVWCGNLYKKSNWRHPVDYREVFNARHRLHILMIGCFGCFVTIIGLSVLQNILPSFFADYQNRMTKFNTGSVLMLAYTVILGPVAEELIFRGAVFDRLYLAMPFSVANFIQASFFGIYHGDIIQGIYSFCFGLLFGMIRYTGGSIYNSIAAHILFNLTNFIVPPLFVVIAKRFGLLIPAVILLCCLGLAEGIISLCRECGKEKNT